MSQAKLIQSIALSCLLFPAALAKSEEPRERESHLDEIRVKTKELERKMAELSVDEATIEVEKLKIQLEAARRKGESHEVQYIEQEIKQAMIRLEMRRVQSEMAGLQVELAKAELEHLRRLQGAQTWGKHRIPIRESPSEQATAVMRTAMIALGKAQQRDLAELLERAIRARQDRLQRKNGDKAESTLESEPSPENTIEALMLASRHWREVGNHMNADLTRDLAEYFARQVARERKSREEDPRLHERKRIEDEVAELEAVIEKSTARMRELRELLKNQ